MSTRGAYGFIKNKSIKATYNHWDSYLEALGSRMVDFIKSTPISELNKIFDQIKLVNQQDIPKGKDKNNILKFLKKYNLENSYDPNNFGNKKKDWYFYLSETQGLPELYKKGLNFMTDDKEFLEDNLFCEYSYLIDLDSNEFIVRSEEKEVKFDLENIPENWMEIAEPNLENTCKDKFMNLIWDKNVEAQKELYKFIGVGDYIQTIEDSCNYYTNEKTYKEILTHIDEKELENILDNYIEKEQEELYV